MSSEHKAKWDKYNRSFVVLAAIHWEILMAACENAKQKIPPGDLLDIRYEDLCQYPVRTFRTAVEFGALEWSPEFEAKVRGFHLNNSNEKWQKDLNDVQQRMLCECLGDTLRAYGYAQTETVRRTLL